MGGKIVSLTNTVNLFDVNKLIKTHFSTEKKTLESSQVDELTSIKERQEPEPDSIEICEND